MADNEYAIRKGEFSWALEVMKQGKAVCREGSTDVYVCGSMPFDGDRSVTVAGFFDEDGKFWADWNFSVADLLAEDWELAGDSSNDPGEDILDF